MTTEFLCESIVCAEQEWFTGVASHPLTPPSSAFMNGSWMESFSSVL